MAEKRMFTKKITESDAFLDMPLSSQALYFHLNMGADDEGFVNNAKRIQRNIGASDDDLKLLFLKRFILPFESGVIVIKHWKMHNYIAKDRFHKSQYEEERSLLEVKDNGAYTLKENNLYTECIQDVYADKNSIDKNSIDKNIRGKNFVPPTLEEVKAYCEERKNTVDPDTFINFYESKGWFVGKNKMKDWKAAVRTWEKNRDNKIQPKKNEFKNFQQSQYDWDEINKELGIK